MTDAPWQPSVIYAPPASATCGRRPSASAPRRWPTLSGSRRAEILAALGTPVSTLGLAKRMRASPAGVSAHLKALRDAGLAGARREGREVLYARTPLGDALLRPGREPRPADPG